MRTIGELYTIVLGVLIGGDYNGICACINRCKTLGIITETEYFRLSEHFDKQKPTIFSKFYWEKDYIGDVYWWTRREKEPRIKFLKFLIKKYKNKTF